jgi:hypothetical protein
VKSKGKEAFAKGDYFDAAYFYTLVNAWTNAILVGTIQSVAR